MPRKVDRPSPRRLEELIRQKQFSDADMVELCSEPNHEFFDFKPGAQFEPGSLRHLARLKRLQFLHFEKSNVTDADLKWLGQIKGLKRLSLNGCPVTSRGMAYLTDLPRLADLWLADTHVGDAGLKHIAKLTHLSQTLLLIGTRVTDRGLRALLPLTQLRGIGVVGTRVTDRGILLLAQLPRLGIVEGGNITEAGVREFIMRQRELKRLARASGSATKTGSQAAGKPKSSRAKVIHSNDPGDPDVVAAREQLFAFFRAMNEWETWRVKREKEADAQRRRADSPEEMDRIHRQVWGEGNAAQQKVFDEFCVPRERAYGRQGSFRDPPTYDEVEKVEIVEIERRSRSTIVFYTNRWGTFRWQFVLKKKGGRWLVDNKKYYASGGWTTDSL